jgi:hypothetical protein
MYTACEYCGNSAKLRPFHPHNRKRVYLCQSCHEKAHKPNAEARADEARWERIWRERIEDPHYYDSERSPMPSTIAILGHVSGKLGRRLAA